MSDALWTSDEIADATGGMVHRGQIHATGVSIDTRSLTPGDLFVALAGDRDGHDFVATALERGASGVLASRAVEGACVIVPDTLVALQALGRAARDRAPDCRRAAVTGSVGKTSVTRAIAAGLNLAGPSHASVKSYNNHIGVPLTLARMPKDTVRAVFEIGMNHANEITPLSRQVAPHVAVVTTVGPVHVENFEDGEAGIARAKAEIFDGMEPGGVAVLNADDRWFDLLADAARAHGAKVASFGAGAGRDAELRSYAAVEGGGRIEASVNGREIDFVIPQPGAHWGPNSMAVLLALEALGVGLDVGVKALKSFTALEGRGAEQRLRLHGGDFTLIDESYNANPLSMRSALRSLAGRSGRRIAVLTDMLELGPDAARYHAALAEDLESAEVHTVFCAGPLMRSLWDGLPAARRGAYAPSAGELAPEVVQAVEPGDAVMVKGSNGSKASLIVKALVDASGREG
ncbi:MAG: UDP-N-acetylmuramoyl-tripeptide--D-alanyl-D-alanine ligase [Caulobacteraceae bacterium]